MSSIFVGFIENYHFHGREINRAALDATTTRPGEYRITTCAPAKTADLLRSIAARHRQEVFEFFVFGEFD